MVNPSTRRQQMKSDRRRKWRDAKKATTEEKVLSKFSALIRDASNSDLEFLARYDSLREDVVLYDSDSNTYTRNGDGAWPLTWVLARFHRKHVILRRRTPNFEPIRKALVQYERKARWRKALDGCDRDLRLHIKIPGAETPEFTGTTCPDLEAWLAGCVELVC